VISNVTINETEFTAVGLYHITTYGITVTAMSNGGRNDPAECNHIECQVDTLFVLYYLHV